MLDLDEPISKMKIIHVAGTKGKVGIQTIITAGFSTKVEVLLPLFWCGEN